MKQTHIDCLQLASIVSAVAKGHVNGGGAKALFKEIWTNEKERFNDAVDAFTQIERLIREKDLGQMNDTGALEAIVDQVIAANAKNVAEFKAGNEKALNGLVGQIMKASKGKANPQQVNDLLRSKLA